MLSSMRVHRLDFTICLFLIVTTIAVFWPVLNHGFVNYDDTRYVTMNENVRAGVSWKGVAWAFTSGHASNWHPLTWLSHMLDCEIYALNPKGHHVTNLLFHLANTVLLFLALRWMTAAFWRPAIVAALFALHPLHVESVAWIAERKDVLSTLFWMLTMLAYAWYVKSPEFMRYLFVVLSFALGLMAKPMLVTLPFVLLLLDYWPLKRLSTEAFAAKDRLKHNWRLVREKLPLFVLTVASCITTFLVQQHGAAVQSLEQISLQSRIENAFVSYAKYITKMIWPSRLAVYYPHCKNSLPLWQSMSATLLFVCISVIFFRQIKRHPYLMVGWLWFLGTLVPVIGIVQVGGQAMADRYTYVPLIGLFVAGTWGISRVTTAWANHKVFASILTGSVISMFTIFAWFQVGYWSNSITLFEHTLNVTANNQLAHNQLGVALIENGRTEEAIEHYLQALQITPQYVDARINLGNAYKDLGKLEKAIDQYRKALGFSPNNLTVKNNLGIVLAIQGNIEQAITLFSQVLQIDPDNARAHNNMGIALAERGQLDEAVRHFSEALRINPASTSARKNLRQALTRQREDG